MARDKERYKYRGPSNETVKQRAVQSTGAFDHYLNTKFLRFKPNDGDNELRILPRTWDDIEHWGDNWGIEIWVHSFIGPDNSNFLCLNKMKGEACPLCDERHEVAQEDEEAGASLKPGKRTLIWLIDKDDADQGPQLWAMPVGVEKDIQKRSQNKKTGAIVQISHPDDGYDVSFTKEGAGKRTKYIAIDISREESPLSENQKLQDKWLDFIEENPLPDTLVYYDADYMKAVYMGKKSRKEEVEDDDDKRGKKTKPGKRGKEKEPEPEPEPISEETLDQMDRKELEGVIDEYELGLDPDDFRSDSKLRAKIAEELKEHDLLEESEPEEKEEPKRRGRGKEEDEPIAGRGRGRDEDEDKPKRGRGKEEVDEEEEEDEDEDKDEPKRGSSRRRGEDDEPRRGSNRDADDDEKTTKRARDSVNRLRNRNRD